MVEKSWSGLAQAAATPIGAIWLDISAKLIAYNMKEGEKENVFALESNK